jgi:HJR/Mrr/RecB family endonuclease
MTRLIWNYTTHTESVPLLKRIFSNPSCPCCKQQPLLTPTDQQSQSNGSTYSEYLQVVVCPECGWWFISKDSWSSYCDDRDRAFQNVYATGAALARYSALLDSEQITLLCNEVKQHLLGKGVSKAWDAMEDATLMILKEFGYQARATARSKDGGVDIILDHPVKGTVYVQVKHSKNKIGVEILRELVGTMCIRGINDALLVTSSGFTKGVQRERNSASNAGKIVELIDGERFISALNLSSKLHIPKLDEILTVAQPSTPILGEIRDL